MKSWNIQRTQYKISDFINWQKSNELNLSPIFQRRAVWPKGAKSYLIDSVLRGLPIPPIILRELPAEVETFRSVREVVDGQQRIRTVLSFVAPQTLNDFNLERDNFKISKSHNKEVGGCEFQDLEKSLKQRILDYQFMVHLFPSETDDRDILEIFARMNATGLKLNNQELRNAQFFGEFKSIAFELSAEHLEFWRSWKLFSESSIARMNEVEFTSELMILIIEGVSSNSKKVIDSAYGKFDSDFLNQDEVVKRVRHVLELLQNYTEGNREFYASKTYFYPIFAAFYNAAFGLNSNLAKAKPKTVSKTKANAIFERAQNIIEANAPKSVLVAVEARVSQANSRQAIIDYLLK